MLQIHEKSLVDNQLKQIHLYRVKTAPYEINIQNTNNSLHVGVCI